MRSLNQVPGDIRAAVRNSGGGHANHQLFWKIMAPPTQGGSGPKDELATQITRDFGSFNKMKQAFEEAVVSRSRGGNESLRKEPEILMRELLF